MFHLVVFKFKYYFGLQANRVGISGKELPLLFWFEHDLGFHDYLTKVEQLKLGIVAQVEENVTEFTDVKKPIGKTKSGYFMGFKDIYYMI